MKFKWITCLIFFSLLVFYNDFSTNAQEANQKHVVTVIVPGMTISDFYIMMDDAEGKLWNRASVAAINRVTGGKRTYRNEILTIVNGRLKASKSKEYDARKIIKNKSITQYEYKYLLSFLSNNSKDGRVIGQLLKENKVHAVFTGHSDVYEKNYRTAPFFVADKKGWASGNIDVSVTESESAPGGYVMEGDEASRWIEDIQFRYPSTWIVVEWGDIYRTKNSMSSEKNLNEALVKLSTFVDKLKSENKIVYLMGMDSQNTSDKEAVMPFVKWDLNTPIKGNELFSPTVQQPFLGSSVDIAPTFLQHYNIKPPKVWHGNALVSGKTNQDVKASFKRETDGAVHIYNTRASVISVYITVLVTLLIIGFIYWKRKKPTSGHAQLIMKTLVIAGMVSPLSFIAAAGIFGRDMTVVTVYCIVVIAISLGIAAVVTWYGNKSAVWIVSCLLLVVISADLIGGASLMKRSYLGYDPLIGARYGGVGNELGGFFAAAAIVFLEPWIRKEKTWGIWPVAFLLLIILGSSYLGKNAGVTLSAGLMFFALAWLIYGKQQLKNLRLLWITFFVSLGLLVILWLLQQGGSTTSHIGHAFQLLFQGEWGELNSIITRKLQTNIKIIMHSNWTKLLVTSYLLASMYIILERSTVLSKSQTKVLKAGGYGSLFLLFLNDSGAVAASTSMFYLLSVRSAWLFQASKIEK